jgi:hypothetical protein
MPRSLSHSNVFRSCGAGAVLSVAFVFALRHVWVFRPEVKAELLAIAHCLLTGCSQRILGEI